MENYYDLVKDRVNAQIEKLKKDGLPEKIAKEIIKEYFIHPSGTVVSVTQLLRPPQMNYLLSRYQFSLPLKSLGDYIYLLFGTALHKLVESANVKLRKDGIFEQGASVIFDLSEHDKELVPIKVTFTPDEIIDGTLVDYKTTSAYKVDRIRRNGAWAEANEYALQLAFYKILNQKYHNIKIDKCKLLVFARDYNQKHKLKNIPPYVEWYLDLLDDDQIEKIMINRLIAFQKAVRFGDYPLCTQEETWGNNRCKGYCDVSKHCEQFNPKIKGLE